jgi:2-dehydro-3-deoxyphosphogluconate aldolase/(4S)-4-hydroxy-2-oxoglutarate aldolase
MNLRERLSPRSRSGEGPTAPVVPVMVIDRTQDAVPLAQACVDGGVNVLEVTLRTPAGLESIRRIAAEVPGAWVGAGTVTTVPEVARVAQAGARFIVSPGFDREIVAAARDLGIEAMPGVMTPSEIMAALSEGLSLLKFFPAAAAGGIPMLKAFAGPFPSVHFCPTGGIDARGAPDYLALPNVVAIGGSWLTPAAAIARQDWSAITTLARAAASLARRGAPA